jgi:hypothetical protein
MGQLLILVESLAAALLLVALTAAWAAGGRWLRWLVPAVVVMVILLPAALLAFGLHFLYRAGPVSLASLIGATGWLAGFLVGALAIMVAAKRGAANQPWPRRSLSVAFAIAAVLTAITMANLDVAVKGQIAAARVEAGAKALALVPRPQDAPNAAAIYRRAFAALTPREQAATADSGRAQPWSQYDRTLFDADDVGQRQFLDSQQRGLALLREAAAVPYCSFERDWSSETSPLDMPLPELPQLRYGATLLAYDALDRAQRGDGRAALDNVTAIFGMARHVNFPLLIELVAARAIEETGAKALEDVLTLAPPTAEDLGRLDLIKGEAFRERLRRVFAMEEAWGMAAFVMLATGRGRTSPDIQATTPMDALGASMLDSPLYRIFFLEDDLASFRRHMRLSRDNANRPAPAVFESLDAQEDEIRHTRGGGILSGLLLPASGRCLYAAVDGDATRHLVRLALAAARYRKKHGAYPDKLTELTPEFVAEVPADPYDGRPIRLRREGAGIVLYSIGRDRRDHSGCAWDRDKNEGDLTFRLP